MCVVAGAATFAALSGCTVNSHRDAVSGVARTFVARVEAGDGSGACALLTDEARSSVPGATDASCPEAITGVKEHGKRISGVQVWGDAAQVHIGDDVLFLRRMSGRWQVSAAGCTPRPAQPYDCEVAG